VIISSGYLSEEMRTEALRLGVRQFVRKENTLEELGPAIHEALGGSSGRRAS
jgi:DNA-binding NarL/FixJ family response regulator